MSCMLHSNFNLYIKGVRKYSTKQNASKKEKGRKGSKYSACNCRVIEQTLELFGHPVVHNIDGLNIMFFTVYTSKKFCTHTHTKVFEFQPSYLLYGQKQKWAIKLPLKHIILSIILSLIVQ